MKVVFIGACGHVDETYNTLKKYEHIKFCGIAPSSEQENVFDFAKNKMKTFDDYKLMLSEIQPDLAIVSPIFGLTAGIAMYCANLGIDIIAEKPVAANLSELKELQEVIERTKIRFCAMHFLRYAPAFYHAKQLVDNGEIGQIKMLTAQKSYKFGTRPQWYKDRSLYVGTIPWVGIHAIDWIYFFSNKRFLSVHALHYGNPEKYALCQFELEDDIIASVNLDYYRPETAPTHDDDRIRIAGTDGIIEIISGEITLMNKNGVFKQTPCEAPNLIDEFLNNNCKLSPEEIFMLTRVALLSRQSADTGKKIIINDDIKGVNFDE